MFKIAILIKRRPGMSMEDFIKYYEGVHAPLAAPLLKGVKKYVRNFLHPYTNAVYNVTTEPPADVVTEFWLEDRAAFERCMEALSQPDVVAILGPDEEKLFDRSTLRFMVVEQHETDMTKYA
jgi:hypothetical protein